MVEDLKKTKDMFLTHMEKMIAERGGVDRVDVKLMGEYADIVKDMAEAEEKCWKAEYYKTVTEAMQRGGSEPAGYTQMGSGGGQGGGGRMGYNGGSGSSANGGRMGYGSQGGTGGGRMGYGGQDGMMGHSDPVAAIRDMLATGSPEMRAQIRNELTDMISMR